MAAQSSVRCSVASALLRGRFGLGDIASEAVADPAVRALADRVTVRSDPALTGRFAPATVEEAIGRMQDFWDF